MKISNFIKYQRQPIGDISGKLLLCNMLIMITLINMNKKIVRTKVPTIYTYIIILIRFYLDTTELNIFKVQRWSL